MHSSYAIAIAEAKRQMRSKRRYIALLETQVTELQRENNSLRHETAMVPQLHCDIQEQQQRIKELEQYKAEYCEEVRYRRIAQKKVVTYLNCLDAIPAPARTIFFNELCKYSAQNTCTTNEELRWDTVRLPGVIKDC